MGSANSKKNRKNTIVPICSTSQSRTNSYLDKYEIPEIFTEEAFKKFKKLYHDNIMEKLSDKIPLSSSEFEKLINKEIFALRKTLLPFYGESLTDDLLDKLRAKTLYYQHLNDLNSYNLYKNTMEDLVRKLMLKCITANDAREIYQTSVFGTYVMQGLQEIFEISSLFENDADAALSLFKNYKEKNSKQFKKNWKQVHDLINFDNTVLQENIYFSSNI